MVVVVIVVMVTVLKGLSDCVEFNKYRISTLGWKAVVSIKKILFRKQAGKKTVKGASFKSILKPSC